MTHVRSQVHEWSGNLLFDQHGDMPYWALREIYSDSGIGGGESNVPVDVDGTRWDVSLSHQKSGLEPRESDSVEQLYEYRLNAEVAEEDDRRTLALLFQPRLDWNDPDRYPQTVPKATPESVNIRVEKAVNIEPRATKRLIPTLVTGVFNTLAQRWNPDFFTGEVHEFSCLTQLERYVRLQREQAHKIVRSDGVFHRLFHTVADVEGSKIVYSADNRDIVGHNHQVRLDTKAMNQLLPSWRTGGQFKHYHPEHVGDRDEDDPLYHPKVGFLFKKKWNDGHSVAWSKVEQLNQQVEENLMNLLEWADVPTKPGGWFVEDDHFAPVASERDVAFYDDPTPEIEREQDSVILRTLSRLTDADHDVLESIALTDGGRHVDEIEAETDWSSSTIYRVLNRLGGLLESDNGNVQFVSAKIAERVQDVLSVANDVVETAARAIEDVLSVDPRDLERKGRAWQNWLNRYAADLVDDGSDGGRAKIRIRTLMTELKSGTGEYAPEILNYGYIAWREAGRDGAVFRNARVVFDSAGGTTTANVKRLLSEARDDILRIPG